MKEVINRKINLKRRNLEHLTEFFSTSSKLEYHLALSIVWPVRLETRSPPKSEEKFLFLIDCVQNRLQFHEVSSKQLYNSQFINANRNIL